METNFSTKPFDPDDVEMKMKISTEPATQLNPMQSAQLANSAPVIEHHHPSCSTEEGVDKQNDRYYMTNAASVWLISC